MCCMRRWRLGEDTRFREDSEGGVLTMGSVPLEEEIWSLSCSLCHTSTQHEGSHVQAIPGGLSQNPTLLAS